MAAGCDDFATKPCDRETIFETISRWLGIRYVYAEDETVTTETTSATPDRLAGFLASRSDEWLQALYEAAGAIDNDRIFELLEEFASEESGPIKAIADLACNFQCDRILSLVEATGKVK